MQLLNQNNNDFKKRKKRKVMSKEIEINGIKKGIDKITANDIITFIEEKHPEDRKKFAKLVFDNTKIYNHFKARNFFFQMYFPEALEKKVPEPKTSDTIYSWLNLEDI